MTTGLLEQRRTASKVWLCRSRSISLLIRDAQEKDIPDILEIFNFYVLNSTSSFDCKPESIEQRAQWFQDHKRKGLPVFVMVEFDPQNGQEQIVGFASLSYLHERAGHLTLEPSMYLANGIRQRGIGRIFMNHLMKAAEDAGSHSMVIHAVSENHASIGLAKVNGFELVGQIEEAGQKFGRWLDVCILQKIL